MTQRRPPAEPDSIDPQLEVWGRELPSLDLETEGIVERIWRLENHLARSMKETLDVYDLNQGEWRLMGHLRYSGPPYRGKPGKLAKHLGLSSGAMTNRLDNMEQRGLIQRLDDPDDRRGVIVELTDAGQRLWEESVGTQAQKEALVAAALHEDEKRALNDLLRRLIHAFEAFHGPVHKRHHDERRRGGELGRRRRREPLDAVGGRLHGARLDRLADPLREQHGLVVVVRRERRLDRRERRARPVELDDDGVELLAAHVRVVRDDDADLDRAATRRLRMPHDRILPHAHGGIMPRRRSVETAATILAP